jgi:hypothetical protein
MLAGGGQLAARLTCHDLTSLKPDISGTKLRAGTTLDTFQRFWAPIWAFCGQETCP